MNQHDFNTIRNTYNEFYYRSVTVEDFEDNYLITFNFEIKGLTSFNPTTKIRKSNLVNTNIEYINYLAFNLGMVELISYWKSTCAKNVFIEAGYLNKEQIDFFKKTYFDGLGEFYYLNNIEPHIDDFMNMISTHVDNSKDLLNLISSIDITPSGNLIPIGGGKDSTVTLELLSDLDNLGFIINPKSPSIECATISSCKGYIEVIRTIDKNLLDLNSRGFLNGHTPFSAMVAFTSFLCSYLTNKEYIVLSNEGSANQSTVIGTNINHQYSKTIDFENDFREYSNKYLHNKISYFSLLRTLNELQIAMIFANNPQYHLIFKSCNVGSKSQPWTWCCNCPKCLFVYIILHPFLSLTRMKEIFGCDMYENKDLLATYLELLGYGQTKPFECVGTFEEVRYASILSLKKSEYESNQLPYLLQYFKDIYNSSTDTNYLKEFNINHNLPDNFVEIIQKELNKYDT